MKMNKITTRQMEYEVNKLLKSSYLAIVPRVTSGLGFYERDPDKGIKYTKIIDHECDLLAVSERNYLTEIEIKISLSDLRADFKKKNGHGGEYIRQFYYAIPDYMLEKTLDLVSKEAGVIVVNTCGEFFETEIKRKAKPNFNAKQINETVQAKLFRLGCLKYWNERTR